MSVMDAYGLSGRVATVTGGSAGIGGAMDQRAGPDGEWWRCAGTRLSRNAALPDDRTYRG